MSMVISPLVRRRVQRRFATQTVRAAREVSTTQPSLADLTCGTRAQIVGTVDTDPATARRLFDLGFAPGAEVQMVRKAPLADPVVFRVAGYDIALRRAQARCVLVSTTALPE